MTVRTYGSDTDFGYVRTLTLTIADMTLLMVMTYPRFIDNYCEIIYFRRAQFSWIRDFQYFRGDVISLKPPV